MKSTGTTLRRSTIHSLQGASPAKQAVLDRIQNVTRELGAIQVEMHAHLAEASTQSKTGKFFENTNAVQALHSFKAELDQLRRILWFYIEETTAKPTVETDPEQQSKRMQHVTELLRMLAPPSADNQSPMEERSISFFDRLNVVIDTYMEEKKPGASAAKAAKNTGN